MPDQLGELFANFRAETIIQVRPPGAAAARRAVRRRRATAVAAVAASVAVVAGGLVLSGGHTGQRSGPPANQDTAGPPSRVTRAQEVLNQYRTDSPVTQTAGVLTKGVKVRTPKVTAGPYLLVLDCVGPGSTAVDVAAGKQALAGWIVTCAEPPTAFTLRFVVAKDGPLVIALDGDDVATDTAAFAVKLVADDSAETVPDPSEESTFNSGVAADLLTADGDGRPQQVTTESDQPIETAPLDKGSWLLSYACAGPGVISFTIYTDPPMIDTSAGPHELTCTDAGVIHVQGVRIDARSTLTITARSNGPARNRAGWAYAVRRG